MWGCYRDTVDPPPSSRVTIKRIEADMLELYCHIPPPGRLILVKVTPFSV